MLTANNESLFHWISLYYQIYRRDFSSREVAFFNLPPTHCGQHIVSYGGYIKYRLVFRGSGQAVRAPDMIIKGNGITLYHESRLQMEANKMNEMVARFWPDEWNKGRAQDGSLMPANREDLLMVLQNVEFFLIR